MHNQQIAVISKYRIKSSHKKHIGSHDYRLSSITFIIIGFCGSNTRIKKKNLKQQIENIGKLLFKFFFYFKSQLTEKRCEKIVVTVKASLQYIVCCVCFDLYFKMHCRKLLLFNRFQLLAKCMNLGYQNEMNIMLIY